jgi:hypothetical protein
MCTSPNAHNLFSVLARTMCALHVDTESLLTNVSVRVLTNVSVRVLTYVSLVS